MLIKFMCFIRPKDGEQHLADLAVYFWLNKKTQNLTKKCDINLRKFKNIESPKMVSKRVNGHYLRSYEQFSKKSDFKCDFEAKSEPKNRNYMVFLSREKEKKVDQKMRY